MSIPIPFPKLKRSLWQLLGPSVVFVAVSLNGGELLLWPSLAANFSLKILWAIPIILVLQFVINLEIERYSLVTGKSTEEHLVGSVKWLAALFAFSVIISLVWPAWMSTAGNLLAVVFLPETATEGLSRNVGLVITAVLLLLTAVVFKARKTYKLIETISKYGLMVALGIILLTVALNFDAEIFLEGLRGLVSWGYIPEEMPRFDFLAALAFGGVAGVLNLAQSEWVIDKKYGVAGVAEKDRGNVEFESAQSRKHFKEWFRTVNTEHFLLFFCANLFSIFLLAYLGRLLLPLGSAQGFGVLDVEADDGDGVGACFAESHPAWAVGRAVQVGSERGEDLLADLLAEAPVEVGLGVGHGVHHPQERAGPLLVTISWLGVAAPRGPQEQGPHVPLLDERLGDLQSGVHEQGALDELDGLAADPLDFGAVLVLAPVVAVTGEELFGLFEGVEVEARDVDGGGATDDGVEGSPGKLEIWTPVFHRAPSLEPPSDSSRSRE